MGTCYREDSIVQARVDFKEKLQTLISLINDPDSSTQSELGNNWKIPRNFEEDIVDELASIQDDGTSSEADCSKLLTTNKLRNLMQAFTNIQVAHEVSVNPNYRLQPIPDSERNEFEKYGLSNKHRHRFSAVFWELLDREIQSGQGWQQTVGLLTEIRQEILALMMPQNCELQEEVDKVLDVDVLTEKSPTKDFDYTYYTEYVLSVMKKICCPSRDSELFLTGLIKKPSELFKKILEMLDLMKLDMENFFISICRPYIAKYAMENERKKLADYIELEYRIHEDGLSATRHWLKGHAAKGRETATVLAKAFGSLLQYNNQVTPETLARDLNKIRVFQQELKKISILGAVVLEVSKISHKIFKQPPPGMRALYSRYMKIIVDKIDTSDPEMIKACMEEVAEEAVKVTQEIISQCQQRTISIAEKTIVYDAVMRVLEPNNYFARLITRRAMDYAEELIIAANDYQAPIPPSLVVVMNEVSLLMLDFMRIVFHNQSCFRDLYYDIIEDRIPAPLYPSANGGNWDISLLRALKKLRTAVIVPKIFISPENGDEKLQNAFAKEREVLKAAFENSFYFFEGCQNLQEPPAMKPMEKKDGQGRCGPNNVASYMLDESQPRSKACLKQISKRQIRFEDELDEPKMVNEKAVEKVARYYRYCCGEATTKNDEELTLSKDE